MNREVTLAGESKRPVSVLRDVSWYPVDGFISSLDDFVKDAEIVDKAEAEALRFYVKNHVVSEIARTTHSEAILNPEAAALVEDYYADLEKMAARALYYLMIVCSWESRHAHWTLSRKRRFARMFGEDVLEAQNRFSHTDRTSIRSYMRELEGIQIGNYVDSLVWSFDKNRWNGGYGGKAWKAVAECLAAVVHGKISLEQMVDTVWTLCHNNGPIFNKGTLYGGYDVTTLAAVLDVQRSGQTPALAIGKAEDTGLHMGWVSNDLKDYLLYKARPVVPSIFGEGYVDWYEVQRHGAVRDWGSQRRTQRLAYGVPDWVSDEEKRAAAEEKAKVERIARTKFIVTPNETVKKITRKELV